VSRNDTSCKNDELYINNIEFEAGEKDIVVLPYATGKEQYNGHRIYGAFTFIAKGEYLMYLDEDNWLEPNHVEELVSCIGSNSWAYSLRKIRDHYGNFVCNDDCESIGDYASILGDRFVDVNCFFFKRKLAIDLTSVWFRRARHPDDQPEVDRLLSSILFGNTIGHGASGSYTVNYRAGSREDSVQAKFFLAGNARMYKKFEGVYPWRK
jgi:glycosyltransferase involved in cell wall biosynthesis